MRCHGRQEQISGEINATYLGSVQSILVESISKRSEAELIGRTMGDKSVIFAGAPELIGQTVDVTIHDTHPHTLFGKLV